MYEELPRELIGNPIIVHVIERGKKKPKRLEGVLDSISSDSIGLNGRNFPKGKFFHHLGQEDSITGIYLPDRTPLLEIKPSNEREGYFTFSGKYAPIHLAKFFELSPEVLENGVYNPPKGENFRNTPYGLWKKRVQVEKTQSSGEWYD